MTSMTSEGTYFWDHRRYNQLSAGISLSIYSIYDIKSLFPHNDEIKNNRIQEFADEFL